MNLRDSPFGAVAIDLPRMILVAGVTYSYSADDFGESLSCGGHLSVRSRVYSL